MPDPHQFIANYEQALATQNWDSVAPLVHENCAVTFSEGTYIGKSAVAAAFRRTFALIQEEHYSINNIHWLQETEDFAVFIYQFSWSGKVDGKTASGSGRGTSVIIYEDNRWQLLCEHLGPSAKQGN